jgi:hypothetical protein
MSLLEEREEKLGIYFGQRGLLNTYCADELNRAQLHVALWNRDWLHFYSLLTEWRMKKKVAFYYYPPGHIYLYQEKPSFCGAFACWRKPLCAGTVSPSLHSLLGDIVYYKRPSISTFSIVLRMGDHIRLHYLPRCTGIDRHSGYMGPWLFKTSPTKNQDLLLRVHAGTWFRTRDLLHDGQLCKTRPVRYWIIFPTFYSLCFAFHFTR